MIHTHALDGKAANKTINKTIEQVARLEELTIISMYNVDSKNEKQQATEMAVSPLE